MGRVVITGSSGLVGTGVVSYALKHANHSLLLVDNQPRNDEIKALLDEHSARVEYKTADLTDTKIWEEVLKGADALIHLPAIYGAKWDKFSIGNTNPVLSWNALCSAMDAGIQRVVMMSSINAIGGLFNKECPKFLYFPVDEDHPSIAEDAYSASKQILEVQADCTARLVNQPNSDKKIWIASIRPHFVADEKLKLELDAETRKDLWGWTNREALARACFLALDMKERGVSPGHERFFIVGEEHCCVGQNAMDMAAKYYPNTEIRTEGGRLEPQQGFYSGAKAERLLGWKHTGGENPQKEW